MFVDTIVLRDIASSAGRASVPPASSIEAVDIVAQKIILRMLLRDAGSRVAECSRRVTRQRELIGMLNREGGDASAAQLILTQLEGALNQCKLRREELRGEFSAISTARAAKALAKDHV